MSNSATCRTTRPLFLPGYRSFALLKSELAFEESPLLLHFTKSSAGFLVASALLVHGGKGLEHFIISTGTHVRCRRIAHHCFIAVLRLILMGLVILRGLVICRGLVIHRVRFILGRAVIFKRVLILNQVGIVLLALAIAFSGVLRKAALLLLVDVIVADLHRPLDAVQVISRSCAQQDLSAIILRQSTLLEDEIRQKIWAHSCPSIQILEICNPVSWCGCRHPKAGHAS